MKKNSKNVYKSKRNVDTKTKELIKVTKRKGGIEI